ncbi:MAG TPA: phenylalanine--tRNA ligase subunit alpha [Rhabdochlamydiaceae bacterium]|jgi:phenylalanyl-tRNA synthetase alpha chain
MQDKVASLRDKFHAELKQVSVGKDVEQIKVKYLGKKGPVQELMLHLREAPSEKRPQWGKEINELKEYIEKLCNDALHGYSQLERAEQLSAEKIDITLPGRKRHLGRKHPINQVLDEIIAIFTSMGFSVQEGPNIDSDYYNFEGLNFPPDHPARDMQDTFYLSPEYLLRTHTSSTQLRVMEKHKPPIRIIVPGKCFRNETISSRSHVFFHQVEGLYIDKGVTFADLLSTMHIFYNALFKRSIQTRFRPSYFPFVEPGLEVDISCTSCNAKGCRLCKYTGWLEVVGAGMVHPNVLKNGGIDPQIYSGYAWGFGIERMAMLRYGIKDIRQFTENDHFFLSQFF